MQNETCKIHGEFSDYDGVCTYCKTDHHPGDCEKHGVYYNGRFCGACITEAVAANLIDLLSEVSVDKKVLPSLRQDVLKLMVKLERYK